MRRELKDADEIDTTCLILGRKAHPDEKGTERSADGQGITRTLVGRKAHPDEKGTERVCP